MRRADAQLHTIALRLVLETISPAPQFLDPSLTAGPDSPWCRALRTKKALLLVCRAWHNAALPLLYEDVVLRRSGQIYALARTIRSNPALYGPLIKKIRFSCYVHQNHESIARDSLVYILQHCPQLAAISFSTTFLPMIDYTWTTESPTSSQTSDTVLADPDALMMEVLKKGARLTALEYHRVFRLQDTFIYSPLPLLQACPHLTTLSLFVPPAAAPTVALRDVHLPHLRALYLHPDTGRDDCVGTLAGVCTWALPALRALHFRPFVHPRRLPLHLAQLLRTHGARLHALDLGCRPVEGDPGSAEATAGVFEAAAAAIAANPEFRHLVVPSSVGASHLLDSPLASLAIRQVDVWASVTERRLLDFVGSGPPLWKHARVFDLGLSNLLEIPHLLPATEREECHDVFGLRVVQRNHIVYRGGSLWDPLSAPQANVYMITSGAFGDLPDDSLSSDSEYVFAHDDQDSSSVFEEGSTTEDDMASDDIDIDEDDEAGSQSTNDSQRSDPHVTLEEALIIFSETQTD